MLKRRRLSEGADGCWCCNSTADSAWEDERGSGPAARESLSSFTRNGRNRRDYAETTSSFSVRSPVPCGAHFSQSYEAPFFSFLGLSCNRAAFFALLTVLLGFSGLLVQNLGLRSSLQERGLIDPLFDPLVQSLPELRLPQRLVESVTLPSWALPPDLLDLGSVGRALGDVQLQLSHFMQIPAGLYIQIRQLTIPTLSFSEKLPRPGLLMRAAGGKPKLPVLIVPGFVTSRLDLWESLPCAADKPRSRVWGSWAMPKAFLMNKQCWLDHLRLDEATGLDPPGVKVRPGLGLESIDYFIGGYHVWARLIEAFIDLGYDANNLVAEPYDWRLALPNLQKRDGYFSRLKARIELLAATHQQKVLVISHSWGDTVFRSFMAWVSAKHHGWVEAHISVYADVAGPTLGVPKSLSSYLSGETRETAEMGFVASRLANMHFSRAARVGLFRTWGGGMGMLPIGGTPVWGNATWAPDDSPELAHKSASYGSMITSWEVGSDNAEAAEAHNARLADTFSPAAGSEKNCLSTRQENGTCSAAGSMEGVKQLDVNGSLELLMSESGPQFKHNAERWSAAKNKSCAVDKEGDDFYFNPLSCPLPAAPSLQMFCMYGTNNPTERAYHYQTLKTAKAFQVAKREADSDPTELDVKFRVHTEVSDDSTKLFSGVKVSDGDGTVPLLSLGGLCQKHWQGPGLNPARLRVVTREYWHEPLAPSKLSPPSGITLPFTAIGSMFRGGARSSDHIDILSHEDVLTDLLRMSVGNASSLHEQITSEIKAIAARL